MNYGVAPFLSWSKGKSNFETSIRKMTLDQYLVPSITYMDEDGQVLTQLQSLYLLCPHNYANNELGGGA